MGVRAALLVATVAIFALAGCGTPQEPDLLPSCPQWQFRQDTLQVSNSFFFNGTRLDGPHEEDSAIGVGLADYHGRPLDRFELEFKPARGLRHGMAVYNATLDAVVTNERTGERIPVLDLRGGGMASRDSMRFESGTHGNFTFYVPLAEPDQPAQPDSIRIDWTFMPDEGASEGHESIAAYSYTVHYMYRAWEGTCSP